MSGDAEDGDNLNMPQFFAASVNMGDELDEVDAADAFESLVAAGRILRTLKEQSSLCRRILRDAGGYTASDLEVILYTAALADDWLEERDDGEENEEDDEADDKDEEHAEAG